MFNSEKVQHSSKMVGFKSFFMLVALWHTVSSCRVEYDTDYLGCDIGASFQPTWEACARACAKSKGCTHFSYYKMSNPSAFNGELYPGKCHLKNSKCKVVHGDGRLISGDRACALAIPPQACDVDFNIDYPGCDIKFSYEKTWRKCAEFCERTKGCTYFTWAKPTSNIVPNKCHLKNSKCGKVRSDNRLISGNKACGTPCQVKAFL